REFQKHALRQLALKPKGPPFGVRVTQVLVEQILGVGQTGSGCRCGQLLQPVGQPPPSIRRSYSNGYRVGSRGCRVQRDQLRREAFIADLVSPAPNCFTVAEQPSEPAWVRAVQTRRPSEAESRSEVLVVAIHFVPYQELAGIKSGERRIPE